MRNNSVTDAGIKVGFSELNKRRVISALLSTGRCSRRDLAERTRLASSTISTITSELIDCGIVQRAGKRNHSAAGRREELVARNPKAATAVTVHYTTDACTFGLVDFGLNVMDEFELESAPNGRGIEEMIAARVAEMLEAYPRSRLPSLVALSLPNHPIPEKVVTRRVSQSVDIPVFGLNNVAAMAVYHNYIAGHGEPRTFSLVYVGTGIGSGLVIDGEVYHGVNGNASDLGHVHIRESPVPCRCGRTGCLETFASLQALSRAVREQFPRFPAERALRGDALVAFLQERLLVGDAFVRDLLDASCADLAKGIRNLATLLDPGTVLVVSRLNRLSPFYEERLRAHYYTRAGAPAVHTTRLEFGEYRPEAGLVGAGLFGFNRLLGGAGILSGAGH